MMGPTKDLKSLSSCNKRQVKPQLKILSKKRLSIDIDIDIDRDKYH